MTLASYTTAETAAQPQCWRRAADEVPAQHDRLPRRGERVAVVGCGTSWFMAQAYAWLRERGGHGITDAFAASQFPAGREYDLIVAISRSGTTTEVLDLLAAQPDGARTLALTADPKTPIMDAADEVCVLDFADERSVVQTRFATSALALLRAHLEAEDALPAGVRTVDQAAADAERVLALPLPEGAAGAEQITFLGDGWTCGLASEAALKMREAAGAWTEAYPAMEYRHGPISITGPRRIAWLFGDVPAGLDEDIARTGGSLIAASRTADELDPMADLVRVHRLAVGVAVAAGRDPDQPRNLTRSVILSPA